MFRRSSFSPNQDGKFCSIFCLEQIKGRSYKSARRNAFFFASGESFRMKTPQVSCAGISRWLYFRGFTYSMTSAKSKMPLSSFSVMSSLFPLVMLQRIPGCSSCTRFSALAKYFRESDSGQPIKISPPMVSSSILNSVSVLSTRSRMSSARLRRSKPASVNRKA